jgi:hypothetical protein
MALILAIAMLLILSILGSVVLDVANRGIRDSGRINPENQAFFTADRAVEYGLSSSLLDMLGVPGDAADLTNTTHKNLILSSTREQLLSGRVEYLGVTSLPASFLNSPKGITSLVDGRSGSAFHVQATAQVSTTPPVTMKVDSVFVRMNYAGGSDLNFGTGTLGALGANAAL